MKKQIFTMGLLFFAHLCSGMQPQIPTIQNRTIIVPSSADARPVSTPTREPLGPVIGGFPPYSYSLRYQDPTNTVTLWNGEFIVTPRQLPYSFEYTATDSQGHQSQPATITLEGGSSEQEETPGLSEVEPG